MKTTLTSTVVLALCVLGALGAPVEERSTQINFAESCVDISFNSSNDVLTAVCKDRSGNPVSSSLSLDSCISNINGSTNLVDNCISSTGDFSASCSGVSFESSGTSAELSASCGTIKGGSITSTVDLNNIVTNTNGILTCP
ncbi:Cyanovirin-N [Schizopora paradoxa]|uniref:Cyanovirin-N n=1 Tax=Schizopora paradoxa TaxID=27342 RepID=A0A0H2R921_9AGAM|nr:Cyanovirin-N [Schizopora paradoxa]